MRALAVGAWMATLVLLHPRDATASQAGANDCALRTAPFQDAISPGSGPSFPATDPFSGDAADRPASPADAAAGTWPEGGEAAPPSPAAADRPALLADAAPVASPRPVALQPRPEDAGGIAVPRDEGNGWLWIPRVLLFVPRWTAEVVFAPVRGGLWAYEEYEIRDKLEAFFFNDEGTIGLYPLAFFETGFGLNAGARFVFRDLLGKGERLRLRASYGGRFKQLYSAKFTTGRLLGDRVLLDLRAEFEIYPKSRFFGIGNRDLEPADTTLPPIDPRLDDTAVETRFRHDDVKVELGAPIALPHHFSLRPSAAFVRRDFRNDADLDGRPLVTDVYDTNGLIGWDDLESLQGELELTFDSRRQTRDYLSTAIPAIGWNLTGFAGPTYGLDEDPSRYVRYGVDFQRYVDLYGGDRVLILRWYLEAVSAEFDDVPFVDLPTLGGPSVLRGYPRHRFRDRVATLGSVEYMYPISRQASGYLFVDTGRVYRSLEDFAFEAYRLGFGGGLYIYSGGSFIATISFASSADGGFFFNLGFDPVYDVRARKEAP